MVPEFANEALTDFSRPTDRQAMQAGLQHVKDEFARQWPLVIGGERVTSGAWIDSYNPCHKDQLVGRVARAGRGEAERALDAAWAAFPDWSTWQPAERARLLLKAAALLRARKHVFSATMVYEAAKTWPEADADTAEAIDFLEFYGREALRLAEPQPLVRVPGEDNELEYLPLGVGIIIPPWNFPAAITIDETADLDAAAEGIVVSAYGFQGQKCSAASRAIVLELVYQEVLGRVARRAEALRQ